MTVPTWQWAALIAARAEASVLPLTLGLRTARGIPGTAGVGDHDLGRCARSAEHRGTTGRVGRPAAADQSSMPAADTSPPAPGCDSRVCARFLTLPSRTGLRHDRSPPAHTRRHRFGTNWGLRSHLKRVWRVAANVGVR